MEIPYRRLVDRGWPRKLQEIRLELPGHLHHSPPSGAAAHGLWIVVARTGGRPVGLAWAVHAAGDGHGAYIEEVAVVAPYQRRGIGRRLLWQIARVVELDRQNLSILPMTGSRWVLAAGFPHEANGAFVADARQVSRSGGPAG